MIKKILYLTVILSAFSTFAQTAPAIHTKMNTMAHLGSYAAKISYDYYLSPWGNWVFTSKKYSGSNDNCYADSIQLFLYKAFDTSKTIPLTTLFPKTLGSLSVMIKDIFGHGPWSIFQDTLYFHVYGSTINQHEYPDCGYDGEIFFIDLSPVCKVRIPNIEYTIPPTGIFKQSNFAGSFMPLAKIEVMNILNKSLQIRYSIPAANFACVNIYNAKGSLLRSLVQQQQAAGEHTIYWDCRNNRGEDLSSGQYFFQIVSGDYISATETILIK